MSDEPLTIKERIFLGGHRPLTVMGDLVRAYGAGYKYVTPFNESVIIQFHTEHGMPEMYDRILRENPLPVMLKHFHPALNRFAFIKPVTDGYLVTFDIEWLDQFFGERGYGYPRQ
jgi:hypothetical protein